MHENARKIERDVIYEEIPGISLQRDALLYAYDTGQEAAGRTSNV